MAPSFTKTFHSKSYTTISPTRPELSAKGKVVLVTGAGSGIGGATAVAFAEASAKVIILCGRQLENLNRTKAIIETKNSDIQIVVYPLRITDEQAVAELFKNIASQIGRVDIVVNGAGHLADGSSVKDSTLVNFWESFEVQVKGTFLVCQQWLRNHGDNDPTFISLNSLLAHLPAETVGTAPASYCSSKIAQGKLVEWIAKENAGTVRCDSLHPGIVRTEMSLRSTEMAADPEAVRAALPWDDIDLPANFCVWLASSEGSSIPTGKCLWVNWDVDELKKEAQDIKDDPFSLTLTLAEWPFAEAESNV